MASLFAMCFRPKLAEDAIEKAVGLENTLVSSPLKRTQSIKNQRTRYLYVTVVSATGLRNADANGLSDPFCVVRLGKESFKTDTKEDTLDPEWDEDDGAQKVLTVGAARVLNIALYDEDFGTQSLLPNDFLGQAEVDIEPYIEQLEQGHGGKEEELCLPLQDPKGKIRKGPANLGKVYVRIGIGYAKDFFAAKLLADREVLGRVSLEIHEAEKLEQAELVGSIDAYCIAEVERSLETTEVCAEASPHWGVEYDFTFTDIKSSVFVRVMDKDLLTADDPVGEVAIPIKTVLEKGGEITGWFRLWGARTHGYNLLLLDDHPKKRLGYIRLTLRARLTARDVEQKLLANRAVGPLVYAELLSPKPFKSLSAKRDMSRIMDVLVSGALNTFGCVWYLHCWEEPSLNVSLFIILFAVCFLTNFWVLVSLAPAGLFFVYLVRAHILRKLPEEIYYGRDTIDNLWQKAFATKSRQSQMTKKNPEKGKKKKKGGILGFVSMARELKRTAIMWNYRMHCAVTVMEKASGMFVSGTGDFKKRDVVAAAIPIVAAVNLAWAAAFLTAYPVLSFALGLVKLHRVLFVVGVFCLAPLGHVTENVAALINVNVNNMPFNLSRVPDMPSKEDVGSLLVRAAYVQKFQKRLTSSLSTSFRERQARSAQKAKKKKGRMSRPGEGEGAGEDEVILESPTRARREREVHIVDKLTTEIKGFRVTPELTVLDCLEQVRTRFVRAFGYDFLEKLQLAYLDAQTRLEHEHNSICSQLQLGEQNTLSSPPRTPGGR